MLRIGANVLGSAYTILCTKLFGWLVQITDNRKNVSADAGGI